MGEVLVTGVREMINLEKKSLEQTCCLVVISKYDLLNDLVPDYCA
jgi:hypothetical protein